MGAFDAYTHFIVFSLNDIDLSVYYKCLDRYRYKFSQKQDVYIPTVYLY